MPALDHPTPSTGPSPEPAATRRSLHAVAELVLAGPQHRRSGTIRLRIIDAGFATITEPALAVIDGYLVGPATRVAIAGATCSTLAAAVNVDVGAPAELYPDGSAVDPADELTHDPVTARMLVEALSLGERSLRRFAADQTPVLWPEHFDLGITVDEVNYGVSPGDTFLNEPYAYVGPRKPRQGPFWNAPFGAARPVRELSNVDDVLGFLTEGRALAHT